MMRLYARSLIAIGLAGILTAGVWMVVVGLTNGASPLASPTYFTCPEGGPAHVRGCPYVNWSRTDLIRLPGRRAAEKQGLCEECLSGAPTLARSRSPDREGTE